MKAAVFYGKNNIKVEDYKEPNILNDDDVKIKIECCGICGSDMEEYFYGPIVVPTSPHPLTKESMPLILGHEFSGYVVETGRKINNLNIGDKIISFPIVSCGNCYWCKQNVVCLCKNMGCIGLAKNGGFAEYIVLPRKNCICLPKNANLDELSLTEPSATPLHAIDKYKIKIGSNVVIIGSGTIGLITLQMAKIAGAKNIIILDKISKRLELAKYLGATSIINISGMGENKIIEFLNKKTNNQGIDSVIECAGNNKAVELVCNIVNKGGNIILIGISSENSSINTNNIVLNEKNILGCHGYNDVIFKKTVDLIITKKINVKPLITKKISLNRIVEDGFEQLRKFPEDNIKILVYPNM